MTRRAALATLVLLVVLTSCSGDDGSATSPTATTSRGDAAPVSGEPEGWLHHGAGVDGHRSAGPGEGPTPAEAGHLELAWQVDDLSSVTATPAVADGVVYAGAWNGEVLAIRLEDGEVLWRTDLDGIVAGSPTVDGEAVYVAAEGSSHRLDRATGEVVWSTEVEADAATQIYGGPTVAGDLVIQPVSATPFQPAQDDYTFKGSVAALDAETGEPVWQTFMTDNTSESGAGVSVWSSAAVDLERGLAFVGTGNSYEEPASDLADSLVALELESGTVAWSHQVTADDVYNLAEAGGASGPDADFGSMPLLWSADGRDLVGAGDKPGTFHALDRETGEVVWATELTTGGRSGGVIGGPAFDGETIYVASNTADETGDLTTQRPTLFALDATTGDVRWEVELDGDTTGPATVAEGVVYQGTFGPHLAAFAAATGERLFQYDPATPVGGGTAVAAGHVVVGFGVSFTPPTPDNIGGVLAFAVP